MSSLHLTAVVIVAVLAIVSLAFLRAQVWDRFGAGPKGKVVDAFETDIDEPIDVWPADSDFDDIAVDLADDDADEHWRSVLETLEGPSDTSILEFREIRSLAAQYLAAYVDNDGAWMALISASTTPDQLIHGMTYVAHTHATVVAFYEDGDIERVVQRDCDSAIGRLAVNGE